MGTQDRRARERAERRDRVVEAARDLAERDGWSAVTTRRLADEIEYTPPVLYQHFPGGRDEIVTAVALLGFAEFVASVSGDTETEGGVGGLIDAYLAFAQRNPATYEAMFAMPIAARFAHDETPEIMRRAFSIFVEALGGGDALGEDVGVQVRAELLWSALHGVCELRRCGRLDPSMESARRAELVAVFEGRSLTD
ncbi:putative TetR-family transcriptional regulator [Gordonia polyisoprenivorans VH2]|uniref:Putative TetR-family transcriptional regulator n=2 Tax=Gordonia TaxID=2053 RepID=H6MVX6_GORPV|nr:TetR/AcrR family transcriptional regulator [Gordonia polyisoprenivorans]AFA71671.1 putative TetR-family transcriptional regulator [Gordonia polyisoprenivorans VH2]MBE7194434.1 TetR/AcrR family transcriptional regulator [Gordonia polyisoprenivorans]